MKKLVVSALALTLISFASVQAQNTQEQAAQSQTQTAETDHTKHTANQQTETTKKKADKEDKVAVKAEDLPEGIKKTIQSDQFSGWTVKKAYLVTDDDNKQYYELQVANGKESARVRLDKNGNNVG